MEELATIYLNNDEDLITVCVMPQIRGIPTITQAIMTFQVGVVSGVFCLDTLFMLLQFEIRYDGISGRQV